MGKYYNLQKRNYNWLNEVNITLLNVMILMMVLNMEKTVHMLNNQNANKKPQWDKIFQLSDWED